MKEQVLAELWDHYEEFHKEEIWSTEVHTPEDSEEVNGDPRHREQENWNEDEDPNDLATGRSDSRQRSGSRSRTPRSSNIKAEFAGKNFVIPRNIKSIINIDQEKNQKIIKAVYNNVNSHYYGLVPLKNIDPQLEFYLGIRNP